MSSFSRFLFACALLVPSTAFAEETTEVTLRADDTHATIERRAGTISPSGLPLLETGVLTLGQWQQTCVAPCQMKLDPHYTYRVAGDGLVPTPSFTLPREGKVEVDAKMGSSTGRIAGAAFIGAGIASIVAGGLALGVSPVLASEDVGSKGFRTGVLAGGIGAVSVGVVSAGVGLFLWLTNGSKAEQLVGRISSIGTF